jgi:hypothetical protein
MHLFHLLHRPLHLRPPILDLATGIAEMILLGKVGNHLSAARMAKKICREAYFESGTGGGGWPEPREPHQKIEESTVQRSLGPSDES